MPELPEVEILVRHLRPLLVGQTIRRLTVHRLKSIRPDSPASLRAAIVGCRFLDVRRRGKYLLFDLAPARPALAPRILLGHLGMTGRMYVLPPHKPRPRHCAADLLLTDNRLVFEDTRYFGRLTTDLSPLERLGPEPLADDASAHRLRTVLGRSAQAIKVKLLDQSLIAGVGNIYASEALFRARIHPATPARTLSLPALRQLLRAIRRVLADAIRGGSTVPLDWAGTESRDRLFYYGLAEGAPDHYEECLRVYDRAGKPCPACRTPIRRIPQAGRSTYFCPRCQPG